MYTQDMTKNKALVGPAIKIISELQFCQFPSPAINQKHLKASIFWVLFVCSVGCMLRLGMFKSQIFL